MELSILYEDADIVAVAKPAGVMVHADGVNTQETVADWFAAHYPASKDVGETQRLKDGTEIARPGIVHRLDTDTSGVLVLAKTQEAHAFLKEAFKARETKKTYLAFVYGVPKEKQGVIDFDIGRSRKDFRLRSAQPKARGTLRDAVTRYDLIGADPEGKHAMLKVMPETGRTHQIRVHLKAIHHPIVCDPLYAPNHPCDLGLTRLGLHAYQLDLPLPGGERITITAPLPADFAAAAGNFPGAPDF
ncbi:MAG TPA: RluA family pseudouridine synthase [Candidatus Paceibacterota bacterium]